MDIQRNVVVYKFYNKPFISKIDLKGFFFYVNTFVAFEPNKNDGDDKRLCNGILSYSYLIIKTVGPDVGANGTNVPNDK